MTDMTNRTAAVIYNPIKVDLESLRAVVDAEASAAGWAESKWYETTEEDPARNSFVTVRQRHIAKENWNSMPHTATPD